MSETLIIDLNIFCGRGTLRQPFTKTGWMYFTDVRVIVRVPADGPDTEGPPRTVEAAFADFPPATAFGEPPAPAYEDILRPCECCSGMNIRPKDWDDELDPGRWDDGEHNCRDCGGNGRVVACSGELWAGRRIATRFTTRIRTLPGLRIGPQSEDPMIPLPFMFHGGQGMVAPYKLADNH